MQKHKNLVQISVWSALAICLSIIEGFIPMPGALYGAKPGLSNIAAMVVMACISPAAAFIVAVVKSSVSALLTGALSSLPYSLAGGISALSVMIIAFKNANGKISFVGISILGAAAHSVGQVSAAAALIQSFSIFTYLPVLLAVSAATGLFTGICANMAIFRMVKQSWE
jgi:heptaprenyl diphosphate synthase